MSRVDFHVPGSSIVRVWRGGLEGHHGLDLGQETVERDWQLHILVGLALELAVRGDGLRMRGAPHQHERDARQVVVALEALADQEGLAGSAHGLDRHEDHRDGPGLGRTDRRLDVVGDLHLDAHTAKPVFELL
jgi:hypothetical protein